MYPFHWILNYWHHHHFITDFFLGRSYCQRERTMHVYIYGWGAANEYKNVFCLQDISRFIEESRNAWAAKASAQSPEILTLQDGEYSTAHVSSRAQGFQPCCVKERPWSRKRSWVIVSHTTWRLSPAQLSLLLLQSRESVVKGSEAWR